MAAGSAAVLTTFLTNLYVCLGCFGVFSLLRVRPWARRFFAPRRYAKDIDLKPKRLPNGALSWIWPVLTYKEEDIIDECGLDCAMYIRILRFGLHLFFILTLWCIIVVLPANLTANEIERLLAQGNNNGTKVNGNTYKFTNFDNYSLSNVPSADPRMWVHLISTYFVVIVTLSMLWRYNKESVLLRLMFLANAKRGGPSHTVLVTDIPGVTKAASKAHAEVQKAKKEEKMEARRRCSQVAGAMSPRKGSMNAVQSASGYGNGDSDAGSFAHLAGGPEEAGGRVPLPPLRGSAMGGASHGEVVLDVRPDGGANGAQPLPTSHPAGEGLTPSAFASPTKGSRAGSYSHLPMPGAGHRISPVHSLAATPLADPEHAATGGRLEAARMGDSKEQLLAQLQAIDPDDVGLTLRPQLCVDVELKVENRRKTKRFQYNMKDESLDATNLAEKKLKAGLTPQQMVAQEFALVYSPDNVAAVNMVADTARLLPHVNEYNKILQDLEDYLDMAQLRLRLRRGLEHKKMTVLGAAYGAWGAKELGTKWFKKIDAVDFWIKRLKFLRMCILEEQKVSAVKVAPSAFVTYNTRMAQAVGATSLHYHDENAWRVQNAPAAFELVWENLGITTPIRTGREQILWAVFWLMAVFFMVPVTAIQAIIEVPKLATIPVLGDIVTAPAIRQLLEAVVPGLALKIFLVVVPIILRIMAKMSGAQSLSEIDFGVVSRYFLFQVIVVFFGNIIAGSFFNQLKHWVDEPASVLTTLGKSIPMTSTFFISYLLVNGLGVKSIAFIRVPGLVIFWLLSRFAGSPNARQRLWMYQYTDAGTFMVDHMIAMLLGLTFSCINPIVCPAALAYFLVNRVGDGYNNIYVYRRAYESAGRLWKTVYNQVMVCLYVMQLTMLALLSIKKFKFSPILIPLILYSIGSHIATLRLFSRPWSVTSLHDAADLDVREADERRKQLLAEAKAERKDAWRALKDAGKEPLLDNHKPGPSEQLLLKMLDGDQFAMSREQKQEIAETYKNPCFKVNLHVIEELEGLAADIKPRLDILNAWVAQLKKKGKKPAPPPNLSGPLPSTEAGGKVGAGKGDERLEAAPPELTAYDHKPDLDKESEAD